MTNEQLFTIYKKEVTLKEYGYSEKTIHTYLYNIENFLNVIDKNILDIKRSDIVLYMRGLDLIGSSYNTVCSSIKSLFTILMNSIELEDMIEYNPCTDIKRPKVANKEKKPLSYEQIEVLLDNCKNTRDVAILTLLSETGLRIHELIALTLRQYEKRDEHNSIVLSITKGSKERRIYLNEKCVVAIDRYLVNRKESIHDNLFISNGGTPMLDSSLRRTWKSIAKKSGQFDDEDIKGICNHLFRTSYATELNNKGVKITTIQEILGHGDLSTTRIYVKENKNEVRDAMLMAM